MDLNKFVIKLHFQGVETGINVTGRAQTKKFSRSMIKRFFLLNSRRHRYYLVHLTKTGKKPVVYPFGIWRIDKTTQWK